jgi:hypothetical protein
LEEIFKVPEFFTTAAEGVTLAEDAPDTGVTATACAKADVLSATNQQNAIPQASATVINGCLA